MSNNFVSDSFETLGGAVKSATGQVKQIVKQMGDDVAENMGLKPPVNGTNEQGGQQQPTKTDDQIKKMDKQQKSVARKKYQQIQDEIRQIQAKRRQDMVKYRQPRITDEEQKNQIKQLEVDGAASVPLSGTSASQGKELPPLPVQRASKKTERMRGVSG